MTSKSIGFMEVSYCRIKMHFFSIAFFEKHKIDGKRNNAKCLRIIRVIVELRRRLRLRICCRPSHRRKRTWYTVGYYIILYRYKSWCTRTHVNIVLAAGGDVSAAAAAVSITRQALISITSLITVVVVSSSSYTRAPGRSQTRRRRHKRRRRARRWWLLHAYARVLHHGHSWEDGERERVSEIVGRSCVGGIIGTYIYGVQCVIILYYTRDTEEVCWYKHCCHAHTSIYAYIGRVI